MKNEKPLVYEKKEFEMDAVYAAEWLIELEHPFDEKRSRWSEFSSWTDYLKDYYLVKNPNYMEKDTDGYWNKYIGIRWDRIHGWKRKALKRAIHNKKKRVLDQYGVWNKYVGRDDVLYIHSRIGGGNWPSYCRQVLGQPWFLEKVDDSFDSTYCDIFAKIEVPE